MLLLLLACAPAWVPPSSPTAPTTPAVVQADGLSWYVLAPGSGRAVQQGDFVHVRYIGWVEGQESAFDSNGDFVFAAGAGLVIRGWDEGVMGMRVGEKRQLHIPPQLGYGPGGVGPIPGNARLVFEVEVTRIES